MLLVTTSFPAQGNGDGREAAGSFVSDLVHALAAHCDVRVVAPGTEARVEQVGSTARIWRFSADRPLSTLAAWKPWHWLVIAKALAAMRSAVRGAACDGRVDHALGLWVLPSGWAIRSGAPGLPYSVWALGSDIWALGRLPGARALLRRVARHATLRFADGLGLAADAGRITGAPFEFLPSARGRRHAPSRSRAEAAPYRLLFLGRWHHNKGVDLLLDALAGLDAGAWSRIREVHIAGGGPLHGRVAAQVARLQARGRPVRTSGFLDPVRAGAALEEADYLIIPSRIESIPVVFSDAMHCSLPVVATPVGDLPDLIREHGVGVLAGGVDADSIARAIGEVLARKPSEFVGGMAAARRQFDPEQIARRLAEAMEGRA